MANILPVPPVEKDSVIFSHLSEEVPVALVTGYTDMRKSIAGLTTLLERYENTNPRFKCLFMFAGRRASSFKALLPEGDGFLLMKKVFFSKRLHWPRLGGKDKGELWWLRNEQFTQLIQGETMYVKDGEGEEVVPEPVISRTPELLFLHLDQQRLAPKTIYVFTGPTDLRKSIAGLLQIASSFGVELEEYGVLAVFCGSQGDRIKIVFNDGDGFILMIKTLFDGKYIWPKEQDEAWEIAFSQLYMLLSKHALSRSFVLGIRNRGER